MACDSKIDLIFKKIDGEITPEEDKLLSAHLRECDDCRCDYEKLTKIENVLLSIPEREIPKTFKTAVADKLRVNPKNKRRFGFRPLFTGLAACIVLALVVFTRFGGGAPLDSGVMESRMVAQERSSAVMEDVQEESYENENKVAVASANIAMKAASGSSEQSSTDALSVVTINASYDDVMSALDGIGYLGPYDEPDGGFAVEMTAEDFNIVKTRLRDQGIFVNASDDLSGNIRLIVH